MHFKKLVDEHWNWHLISWDKEKVLIQINNTVDHTNLNITKSNWELSVNCLITEIEKETIKKIQEILKNKCGECGNCKICITKKAKANLSEYLYRKFNSGSENVYKFKDILQEDKNWWVVNYEDMESDGIYMRFYITPKGIAPDMGAYHLYDEITREEALKFKNKEVKNDK